MEYRLYNKVNCSLFDLIGHDEPAQTKCLGYLLAKSSKAMEAFLELLYPNNPKVKKLLKYKWVVNCELRQPTVGAKSVRADFIIRFYNGFNPELAIIIEAKSATSFSSASMSAIHQVMHYRKMFTFLNAFSNIELVTLTNFISYSHSNGNVIQIRWNDVISELYIKSQKEELITEFINYYNKIMGTMNFYDAEVLSIPAGRTGSLIDKCYIYECPAQDKGQYAIRAKSRPLYLTFRQGGNNCGRMKKLYKIKDIIVLDFNDTLMIDDIDKSGKYKNFKKRINCYGLKPNGLKYVFVLDDDLSFDLPYPVEYDPSVGINGNKQGHDFLRLKDMLAKPPKGQKVVKLPI